MLPDMQRWYRNHLLNMWLAEVDLSVWINGTPQQDAKSNNATLDNEQHNAAPGWRNYKKTQKKTLDILYVGITYLYW